MVLAQCLRYHAPGGTDVMLGLMMTLALIMGFQDPAGEQSRAATLEEARQEKAENLQKPTRTFLEQALHDFKEKRVLERFQEGFHGLHPIIGGIRSGSGFGGGTYVETETVRASGQVSLKGYQKYELRFKAPLNTDLMFADLRATYRNFPQERFFGIGDKSKKGDQTSYRLEDTNYVGR